jgi:hypothetical protein
MGGVVNSFKTQVDSEREISYSRPRHLTA